jgi:transposase
MPVLGPRKCLSSAKPFVHTLEYTMPPRTVSMDLKARIPILHQRGYSVRNICYLLGVKKTLVYKAIRLYKHLPASSHHNGQRGRRRALTINDIAFITAVLRQNPTMYLDELQHELHARRGVRVSASVNYFVLYRAVQRWTVPQCHSLVPTGQTNHFSVPHCTEPPRAYSGTLRSNSSLLVLFKFNQLEFQTFK